jgi:hypothetical protein
MGKIGPNAELRLDGVTEHGIAEISFEISKEKTPTTAIGKDIVTGFTTGPVLYTFSGQAIAFPDGTFGINYDGWCKDDEEYAGAFSCSGRKERFVDMVLDTVGTSYNRDDGKLVKDISGKFADHSYE